MMLFYHYYTKITSKLSHAFSIIVFITSVVNFNNIDTHNFSTAGQGDLLWTWKTVVQIL